MSAFSENLAEKASQLSSVVLLSLCNKPNGHLKAKEDSGKVCCLNEHQSLLTFSQTGVSEMYSSHSKSWGFSPSKISWSLRHLSFSRGPSLCKKSLQRSSEYFQVSLPQQLHSGCSWPSMPHLPPCAHLGDALQHKLCPKP